MLPITAVEEIQSTLLELSALVDKYEARDADFRDGVRDWLVSTEALLAKYQLPQAGELATLRGYLVSANRGVLPDDVDIAGRPSARKAAAAAAEGILRKATTIIARATDHDRQRYTLGEDLAREIVALAGPRGLLPGQRVNGDPPRVTDLQSMWVAVSQDPAIADATARLASTTGLQHALILLARELNGLVNGKS